MAKRKRYRRKSYGEIRVSKIFPKENGYKTVGLQFGSEEAKQLANYLLEASREEKTIDITGFRKSLSVTVTVLKKEEG